MTNKTGSFRRYLLECAAISATVGAFILLTSAAPAAAQYAAGAPSLDSFSATGSNGDANNNPCATGMSDHCGNQGGNATAGKNDPCATGMSDHCGNQGGNTTAGNNDPCATGMSDHCGNKSGSATTANNKPVTATTLIAPTTEGALGQSQTSAGAHNPTTTPAAPALGSPLTIVPNR